MEAIKMVCFVFYFLYLECLLFSVCDRYPTGKVLLFWFLTLFWKIIHVMTDKHCIHVFNHEIIYFSWCSFYDQVGKWLNRIRMFLVHCSWITIQPGSIPIIVQTFIFNSQRSFLPSAERWLGKIKLRTPLTVPRNQTIHYSKLIMIES